jgi:hypothetical protein
VLVNLYWRNNCAVYLINPLPIREREADYTAQSSHPFPLLPDGGGDTKTRSNNTSNTASGLLLAREWAKYHYGVFSESGFAGDPIYPLTYTGKK